MYESDYISFEMPLKRNYSEEQIYLKLAHDYYRINPSRELEDHFNKIADVKAKYILAKEYLNKLIPTDNTDTAKKGKNIIPQFKDLLHSDEPKEVTKVLKSQYNDKKPKEFTLMLFALIEMKYLSNDIFSNKTRLYSILSTEFCFQPIR